MRLLCSTLVSAKGSGQWQESEGSEIAFVISEEADGERDDLEAGILDQVGDAGHMEGGGDRHDPAVAVSGRGQRDTGMRGKQGTVGRIRSHLTVRIRPGTTLTG